jgi:ubiquinone/menaquinone biosynthesis C-methylase UbiE
VTDYDAELRLYNEVLRRTSAVQRDDHVLDIGCGAGQTTRDAARRAPQGRALGIDTSAPAIERASRIAQAEGLHNVRFEHADAQVFRFAPSSFDLAISRFGTMFFADPVAAFTNIGRALRPGGRLVMMVWQPPERNEWDVALREALTQSEPMVAGETEVPDPFSLAAPAAVESILEAAGFGDIAFTDVQQPVFYGPDVATALDWVRGFSCTNHALAQLDAAATSRALARLRELLVEHMTDGGVCFNSRAWMVAARRL